MQGVGFRPFVYRLAQQYGLHGWVVNGTDGVTVKVETAGTMAWMYILECGDGSYYVGSTKNLEQRLFQHQEGIGAKYTSIRLPVKLVYSEEYSQVSEAYAREKQVQN